jgi:hypothetical protein
MHRLQKLTLAVNDDWFVYYEMPNGTILISEEEDIEDMVLYGSIDDFIKQSYLEGLDMTFEECEYRVLTKEQEEEEMQKMRTEVDRLKAELINVN